MREFLKMREFLFRKPPEVFAVFITLPILLYIAFTDFFMVEVSLFAVLFLVIEGLIMFHVYTLIRDLDPKVIYNIDVQEEFSEKIEVIPDYDLDDVELLHLQQWKFLFNDLGFPALEEQFNLLINEYILRQKQESKEREEGDKDGDILA